MDTDIICSKQQKWRRDQPILGEGEDLRKGFIKQGDTYAGSWKIKCVLLVDRREGKSSSGIGSCLGKDLTGWSSVASSVASSGNRKELANADLRGVRLTRRQRDKRRGWRSGVRRGTSQKIFIALCIMHAASHKSAKTCLSLSPFRSFISEAPGPATRSTTMPQHTATSTLCHLQVCKLQWRSREEVPKT